MVKLDLVEREAVKDAIGFMNLHFLGHGENKSVLDSINEVPSVDAVPVVRCKDCKYCDVFQSVVFSSNILVCMIHSFELVEPTDYCSKGERKDND